ncbi:MAG: GGDEF and EAL domain-containing protein [Oscillospiraceae bacterium]
MNKKYDFIIVELIVAICSAIVILYAWINKDTSFLILVTYLVVEIILATALTITTIFSRKKQIELNKNQIDTVINMINSNVIIWRSDYKHVIPNDKVIELLGIGKDTSSWNCKQILTRLFTDEVFTGEGVRRMLQNKGDEFYITSASGDECITVWNTSVLLKTKKYFYFASIGFDLTEIKKMQQELEISAQNLSESESRYSLSMELAEIGIILTQNDNSMHYISDELKNILGIDSNYIPDDEIKKRIHKSDKLIFDTYVDNLIKSGETSEVKSIELRLLCKDNKYHWFLHRYKSIRGINGKVTVGGAFIGIDKDKEKDLLIERLAYIDEITDIGNRNKLMSTGQEIYECSKELNYSYWVVVLDIDRFHIINDVCGYATGNLVLKDFAHILYKYTSNGGLASRISGDNFALIMRDYGDLELPKKTIESIQSDFAELTKDKYLTQSFSCSGGYALMPHDAKSFAGVLERAEFSLSSAEKKRSSIVAFDTHLHDVIINHNKVEKELFDAIANHELALYYQPKIDIKSGKIIGVEALIRWIKPDGTVIPPAKFVPVAEGNPKLITKIGDFVLEEACKQNKLWQDMGYPKIIMSINLTSEDFYQKNIKECVLDTLAKTKLKPEWLEVELTESLAMKDIDSAIKQMQELRNIGIRLAMDDFGTGYSSLSYIKILPVTLIKLDRSFIIDLETDQIARLIVSAIIDIAKCKNIETIAEGMETPAQVQILKDAGCDFAQGYLYGKPMPPEELQEFMEENIKNPKIYWN